MITVKKSGVMSVSLSNGEHEIISDVAKNLGGEDLGLNPHELIEAALGACTTLTLELYGKRKNWDLTGIVVEVKITQETKEGVVIQRKITFGPQNTEEEKKRMLEIADKCPIHNLLQNRITIQTTT